MSGWGPWAYLPVDLLASQKLSELHCGEDHVKHCSCLRTVCSRGCFSLKSGALPDLASHTSGNRLLRREQESLKPKSSHLHWVLCPFEETLSHHPNAKQTNQSPLLPRLITGVLFHFRMWLVPWGTASTREKALDSQAGSREQMPGKSSV